MDQDQADSEFSHHEECEECGSSDAKAVYSDGHAFCFSCEHHSPGKREQTDRPETVSRTKLRSRTLIDTGEVRPLTKRGIKEETCRKWRYEIGEAKDGSPVQIANYIVKGRPVAQKLRYKGKNFSFIGETKDVPLYGQWLWRDSGKMLVITEGEIDALTVSQLQNNKWPVVSVPNGAAGAKKALRKHLEWVCQFDSVVFMFDQDDPGHDAAHECAALLPPGKAKIATLPLKDANEMLKAGRGSEVIDAIWGAKVYRPDGIIDGRDTWELVNHELDPGLPYPWEELTNKTYGLRLGEVITFTAGSGIGKSQVCREIGYHLLTNQQQTVGVIALEESVRRSALGYMSLAANKQLHLSQEGETQESMRDAWEKTLGTGRLFLYDHFGSLESDNLLAKVRYLAHGCGCQWIILDHISIVVSGIADGDERRLIDNTMTELRSLVEETGVGLLLVSHLKRPEGRAHEEGGLTSLSQLRGSAAIAQLSDMVIGMERNQQDEKNADVTTLRVLKNRYSGDTGIAGHLLFDRETGRMTPTTLKEEEYFGDEETAEY